MIERILFNPNRARREKTARYLVIIVTLCFIAIIAFGVSNA